jgi:predicted glycoside hydrolase/deacetylase ChbG (UPF0249 family)
VNRLSEHPSRLLVVTADDYGIGPDTSRGILDLATRGAISSAVLLVNSPFAEQAVDEWKAVGRPMELGWHPCLTLDAPVLSPDRVPSLVDRAGRFPGLGRLLRRLVAGRVRESEIEAEFHAQLNRFIELVGGPPPNVNAHHHVHVFRPVGAALARILAGQGTVPFVRRVIEPLRTLARVPGARLKRAVLTWCGRRASRAGAYPGADALIGLTDPQLTDDPRFFARWLAAATGRVVELCCHPGYFDPSLVGRDGTATDGLVLRRPRELALLSAPDFLGAVRAGGFTLVPAAEAVRARGFTTESTEQTESRRVLTGSTG